MTVIVDAVIWSLTLRRDAQDANLPIRHALRSLILDKKAIILGAIRQEVLSGIRSQAQFDRLRRELSIFPDLALTTDDYELAANFFNRCRSNGIQGSSTDFLICAAAHRRNYEIFTNDRDFEQFQAHIPVRLFGLES